MYWYVVGWVSQSWQTRFLIGPIHNPVCLPLIAPAHRQGSPHNIGRGASKRFAVLVHPGPLYFPCLHLLYPLIIVSVRNVDLIKAR